MGSTRSAGQEACRESLDVAFRLLPEEVTDATSEPGTEAARSERETFAPARRIGEILRAVTAALRKIPFGEVHVVDIRGINRLTVEKDVSMEAPIDVRARTVGARELTAGRRLVAIQCELTNRLGDRLARFSVETEATADLAADPIGIAATTDSVATTDPDVECVDNIPV